MCEISTILYEYPKRHGLSVEWIADNIGVNASTLHRYLNPHDHLSFPLKLLIPFCKACNNDYSAVDMLESRLNRVAISVSGAGREVTTKSISKISEQQGRALGTLIEALADNTLTADEKVRIREQYLPLARQIHTILEICN